MKYVLFSLFVFVFGLFAVVPSFASSELAGTAWDLVSYDGTGAVGTLEFTEEMMYSTFCNNVSQGFVYSSGTLIASGVGMSTMMYCEGLPMVLEDAFDVTEPAEVVLSGSTLTITTDAQHVFIFEAQAPTICTMEYMPVCGEDGVTYGNACAAAAAKVAVVSEGVCPTDESCVQKFDGCNTCTRLSGGEWACTKMYCETPTTPYCIATSEEVEVGPIVGGDADEHGCIGSAGYSWSQSQQTCVRVWENTGATALATAYDFAFNVGMTTMETIEAFRADDSITRQEAAKMLVAFVENYAGDVYSGGADHVCVEKYMDKETFDSTLTPFIAAACGYRMMQGSASGTVFLPNDTLTQGQSLAILMRSLDGWQTEPDNGQWWMPYVVRAEEIGLITFESTALFNDPISRGDLIEMTYQMAIASTTE